VSNASIVVGHGIRKRQRNIRYPVQRTFNRLVFRQEVIWSPSLNQNTLVKDTFFAGYDGINPTLQLGIAGTA
jgi:hypothetical protein